MKKTFRLVLVITSFVTILAGCSSSKNPSGAMHNRGVNNRHFQGY